MKRIIRIKKGRYVVMDDDGSEVECTARGSLKIKTDGIAVGDFVRVDNGVIVAVEPRKNRIIRPPVANIDTVAIIAANVPAPDFYLIDKLLASCRLSGINSVIAVNKIDLTDETYSAVSDQYGAATKIFGLSVKTGYGMNEFSEYLRHKTVVFTGQSAVGKTSLINAISGRNSKTGELSVKTGRGKQTTTASEIVRCGDIEVIDTPGFSAFDLTVDCADIPKGYAEFGKFADKCRFTDCSHVNEPDCGVKNAVSCGCIDMRRYRRYVEIYKEVKNGKKY